MSPYRTAHEPVQAEWRGRGRWRWTSGRKFAGILLAAVALRAAGLWHDTTCEIEICGAAFIVGIVLAVCGRSRTPYTRLCARHWNRGDRLGAVLLFFNVIEPRVSLKRVAQNKAALAAAQLGMPKPRLYNVPFVHDDE